MSTTRTVKAKALPRKTTKELDMYAAEFAKLVDRRTPSRSDTPSEWLRRLPDEAFNYYMRGIASFGSEARTPIERRGRLYLIHTAILFLWMKGGKETAREQFRRRAEEATRRAAYLVTLEHYRRAGVLADYEVSDWFTEPVNEWQTTLISGAVTIDRIPDEMQVSRLRDQTTVTCSVGTFSTLRSRGALSS